eukprot:8782177-Karenia_brevis.AAC.1
MDISGKLSKNARRKYAAAKQKRRIIDLEARILELQSLLQTATAGHATSVYTAGHASTATLN